MYVKAADCHPYADVSGGGFGPPGTVDIEANLPAGHAASMDGYLSTVHNPQRSMIQINSYSGMVNGLDMTLSMQVVAMCW